MVRLVPVNLTIRVRIPEGDPDLAEAAAQDVADDMAEWFPGSHTAYQVSPA